VNKCCADGIGQLVEAVNKKFSPLLETESPLVPMTAEQFGMFKILVYLNESAEDLLKEKVKVKEA